MNSTQLILGATLAAVAIPGAASAGVWTRHHPARTEINARIRHQDRRIREERREGDLTRAQARSLRLEDRSVLAQERADARTNGSNGHLTRQQVRTLNQELNANSKAIGK